MTEQYYNEHAAAFINDTLEIDMTALYAPFLEYIPTGGHILDAGCGSGRDSRAFLQRGYLVTACDAAESMVVAATAILGQPVLQLRFQELSFEQIFDGVWCCASLLHVPQHEMDDVLNRIARALNPGGILYASFKYGEGEEKRNGRYFTNYTEQTWSRQRMHHLDLEHLCVWTTADVRSGHTDERWLNVLMRQRGQNV